MKKKHGDWMKLAPGGSFYFKLTRVKTLAHKLPGPALCKGLVFKEVTTEMKKKGEGRGGNGKRKRGGGGGGRNHSQLM